MLLSRPFQDYTWTTEDNQLPMGVQSQVAETQVLHPEQNPNEHQNQFFTTAFKIPEKHLYR